MKKKIILAVIVLGLLGASFPIINMFIPLPPNPLTDYTLDDVLTAKAAQVISEKCAVCHMKGAELPLYGKLPVIRQLLEYDARLGQKNVDYAKEFLSKGPVSEPVLAKTEFVVDKGTMPPMRYLVMHLNHFMTSEDKKALKDWVRETRAKNHAPAGIPAELAKEALQPLPDSVPVNAAKAALGDKLFHDVRLSKDNTVSCATCHDLKKGGTDQEAFSDGVGGKKGDINSPTVFNAGFQFMQFWDGRAANLEEQADGPVNNPVEMASNWEEVAAKLTQDADFTQAFLAVYPDGYKKENFVNAIAEFERTLITPAPFDKFLKGEKNALTAEQKEGLKIFQDTGCATCHCGVLLGGKSFEVMGLHKDYFAERGNEQKPDFGRFNVTKDEVDKYRLKVPTLRNIKLTSPYLHDSSISDLGKVVETMAKCQTASTLSTQQISQVVQFLDSLTGEFRGQKLQ